MKNALINFTAVILFSLSGVGLFKVVQAADNKCQAASINIEQYRDCMNI